MIWAVGGGRGINLCPNSPKFRHPTPSGAAFPEKTKEMRVGQGGISHLGKRKKKKGNFLPRDGVSLRKNSLMAWLAQISWEFSWEMRDGGSPATSGDGKSLMRLLING